MTVALERGEWSAARPCRTLPPVKTRYPFYRRLGGFQGRSGRAENLVPTGIRSRTDQPIAHSLHRLSYPAHTRIKYYPKCHNAYHDLGTLLTPLAITQGLAYTLVWIIFAIMTVCLFLIPLLYTSNKTELQSVRTFFYWIVPSLHNIQITVANLQLVN